MERFIYVFGDAGKDILLKSGYKMLRRDIKNKIYVFLNEEERAFNEGDFIYATSDTLPF